ncbi:MAG: ribosome silencing factor [Burkholderiales bacterium]
MNIRQLQRAIVDGLEDVKAQDIVVFDTEHLSALFERVIVASGTSNRQTKALAASVRDKVRGEGGRVLSVEGGDNGEWIIVDCGAAVVHIMQPAIRHYYHLEELWGDKPVRVKLGSATHKLVKASEPDDEAPVAKKPARKTAPKLTPAELAPARKAPGRQRSAPTLAQAVALKQAGPGRTTAKKAAKKTAAGKSPAAKFPARKKVAGKTAQPVATVRIVTKRAAPVKKAAAKTVARKAPVKAAVKTAVKTAAKTATKTAAKSAVRKPRSS